MNLRDSYHSRFPQRLPEPERSRAVEVPYWVNHSQRISDLTLEEVSQMLSRVLAPLPDFSPRPAPSSRPAAILIPILEVDGKAALLLTRRSWELSRHQGELSFPGGGVEEGETFTQAALREANEEVGLHPDKVELIGTLGNGGTISARTRFTSIVGIVKDHSEIGISEEVDGIIPTKIEELLRPGVYSAEMWFIAPLGWRRMNFFALSEDLLWGATANLVDRLLSLLLGEVEHGRSIG